MKTEVAFVDLRGIIRRIPKKDADMSELNPLPEFSRLIVRAARATYALNNIPAHDLQQSVIARKERQALIALVDFVRDYDSIILHELE